MTKRSYIECDLCLDDYLLQDDAGPAWMIIDELHICPECQRVVRRAVEFRIAAQLTARHRADVTFADEVWVKRMYGEKAQDLKMKMSDCSGNLGTTGTTGKKRPSGWTGPQG